MKHLFTSVLLIFLSIDFSFERRRPRIGRSEVAPAVAADPAAAAPAQAAAESDLIVAEDDTGVADLHIPPALMVPLMEMVKQINEMIAAGKPVNDQVYITIGKKIAAVLPAIELAPADPAAPAAPAAAKKKKKMKKMRRMRRF